MSRRFNAKSLAKLAALLGTLSLAVAAPPAAQAETTVDIINAAPASDWHTISQDNLLYMTILGKDGLPKQIIIELAPELAPQTVAQIRSFAHHKLWDNTDIYRVDDNYVAQFGVMDKDDNYLKPLPFGTNMHLAQEFTRPAAGLSFVALQDKEPYSDVVGLSGNFPVAIKDGQAFMPHCYGVVGVSRGMPNDNYTASDLYVMIGQPARHLDRQITATGRVIEGIEHLAVLPRGGDDMGFYDNPKDNIKILAIRLGSDLPISKQIQFEALDTKSATFAKVLDKRRNRKLTTDDWFVAEFVPHLDVCYVQPKIRRKAG